MNIKTPVIILLTIILVSKTKGWGFINFSGEKWISINNDTVIFPSEIIDEIIFTICPLKNLITECNIKKPNQVSLPWIFLNECTAGVYEVQNIVTNLNYKVVSQSIKNQICYNFQIYKTTQNCEPLHLYFQPKMFSGALSNKAIYKNGYSLKLNVTNICNEISLEELNCNSNNNHKITVCF